MMDEGRQANVLVAYHSQSGHTRQAAEEVAAQLGADLERIVPARAKPRSVFLGGFMALTGRREALATPKRDLSPYDLVVVGSPVWAAHTTPALRTYLDRHRGEIPAAAAFVTCAAKDAESALDEIARLLDQSLEATTAITDGDRREGRDAAKLHRFVDQIEAALAARMAPSAA
ncbi:MAG: NAD(P)H-dependent oxidoreductase [Pseudomonadota bacterium]